MTSITYATTVREMKATFSFCDFTIDFTLLLESFQLHTYNIIVQWLWEWFGGRLGPPQWLISLCGPRAENNANTVLHAKSVPTIYQIERLFFLSPLRSAAKTNWRCDERNKYDRWEIWWGWTHTTCQCPENRCCSDLQTTPFSVTQRSAEPQPVTTDTPLPALLHPKSTQTESHRRTVQCSPEPNTRRALRVIHTVSIQMSNSCPNHKARSYGTHLSSKVSFKAEESWRVCVDS